MQIETTNKLRINMPDPQTQNAVVKSEEKAMEFIPYGAQDKIKLSIEIIKNIVAKPTKSGKTCSNRDAINFLMLCSGKRLNPFEGDCYLVGYDNQQTGVPDYSQITAESAFLKRAELHPDYDGLQSGLILQNEDGSIQEVEGEFYLDGQNCIGAWARVTHKKRSIPTYDRLKLSKYIKRTPFWENNPEHQIAKCARVAVLRRSFPTMLGGLYLAEEIALPMTTVSAHEIPSSGLVEVHTAEPNGSKDDQQPEVPAQNSQPRKATPQEELQAFVTAKGFTFEDLHAWGIESGNIASMGVIKGFSDIPSSYAARWLKARKGLEDGLNKFKRTEVVV
jgi:phage recombination protein Bet